MSLVQTLLGELNQARHDASLRESVNLLTARLAEFAPTPPPREPAYGARMRQLHDLGYTIKEMALEEKIALGTAYNRCSTLNLEPNPPGLRAVREAEAREAALRAQLERQIGGVPYNTAVGIQPTAELAAVRQAEIGIDEGTIVPDEAIVAADTGDLGTIADAEVTAILDVDAIPSFEEFVAAEGSE